MEISDDIAAALGPSPAGRFPSPLLRQPCRGKLLRARYDLAILQRDSR
jgi:hypothetical protein